MLKSEGYKMFRGCATIVPKKRDPYEVHGDWLYNPEWDCWYVNGSSYPAEIVKDISEDQENLIFELMEMIRVLDEVEVTADNAEEVKRITNIIRKRLESVG